MEMIDGKPNMWVENSVEAVSEKFLNHLQITGNSDDWQKIPEPDLRHGIGLILVKDICTLLNIDFFTEIRAGMAVARLTFNEQQRLFPESLL